MAIETKVSHSYRDYSSVYIKCDICGDKQKLYSYGNPAGARYGRFFTEQTRNEFHRNHPETPHESVKQAEASRKAEERNKKAAEREERRKAKEAAKSIQPSLF